MRQPASNRLRVAAIDFLNPAPLMWDFEHPPRDSGLAERYLLHYTQPSRCAAELEEGSADLGLIPIAALHTDFAIVPGCTIASLNHVRSIQLIVKLRNEKLRNKRSAEFPGNIEDPNTIDSVLTEVRTVATDTASRSSLVYAQILFQRFLSTNPIFLPASADPVAMLAHADAALLIGDPALLALEARREIEAAAGPCLWLDLADQWRTRTGLPWVAAVWAVRPGSLAAGTLSPRKVIEDLQTSRDNGLLNIPTLVGEWTPRIALSPTTIRDYLTCNIHYTLSPACIETIHLFRRYAAEAGILPALPHLRFL